MNINSVFPSKYLKAADLGGRTVKLTIASIVLEKVGQDNRPVAYFQGKDKGIVLNKTNANTIAKAYGEDTDRWIGGTIEAFPAMVEFQGQSMESIRVRVPNAGGNLGAVQQQVAQHMGGGNGGQRGGLAAELDDDIPFGPVR